MSGEIAPRRNRKSSSGNVVITSDLKFVQVGTIRRLRRREGAVKRSARPAHARRDVQSGGRQSRVEVRSKEDVKEVKKASRCGLKLKYDASSRKATRSRCTEKSQKVART